MRRVRFLVVVAVLALLALPTQARAHPTLNAPPLFSLQPAGDGMNASLLVAQDDARVIGEHLGLGPIRLETMGEQRAFAEYVGARLTVAAGARPCASSVAGGQAVSGGFLFSLRYDCGVEPDRIRLRSTLLHDVDERYRTVFRVHAPGGTEQGILTLTSPAVVVELVGAAEPSPVPEPSASPTGRTERIVASLEGVAGAMPFAVALGLAFLVGMLHALTPGHGKTLTAAYLAGEGGTVGHAVGLGGVVAVTHAASVAILGAVAVAAGSLSPADIQPWLEIGAGVLILALAVTLLRARPPHDHDHPHGARALPFRRLAAVGLVGGLVPSPDALAVVLVAFSIGRWAHGALLIAAFSLGLAVVVLGIALVAVRGGALLRRAAGGRFVAIAPRVAAAVFAAMGVVVIATGLRRL